jgi:hypothetical protein
MRLVLGLLLVMGSAGAQGIRPPEAALELIQRLTVASFPGSTQDSIQSLATDASGNIFVAGTTYSAAFPVKNAAQAAFGEATILQTTNLGATWTKAGNPPGGVTALAPDPVAAAVVFATNANGIYKRGWWGDLAACLSGFDIGNRDQPRESPPDCGGDYESSVDS